MYDVIVIGAGPSGLNATARLVNYGLNVAILERKKEIGKNVVCTGIVGHQAFEEFDLSAASILTEVKKVRLTSPFNSTLDYEHPRHFAYVVDREKFDKHLAEKIPSRMAQIKLETEVKDITVNKNHIEVISERGKIEEKLKARMVLVSTGSNYCLSKKLGLGYAREFLKGVQVEFSLEDMEYTEILIGKDVAPGAFGWIVPVGKERARIGLMTDKDPKFYFKRLMKKLPTKISQQLNIESVRFKTVTQGLFSNTYGDRILAVGEAAGQVKNSTGGGIYYGLLCSDIASQVVIESFERGSFSREALAVYEKRWKKAIQKEILTGYYARKICTRFSNIQVEKLFQIVKNDGVFPIIKKEGDFDWHSDLIFLLMKRIPLWQIFRCKIDKSIERN